MITVKRPPVFRLGTLVRYDAVDAVSLSNFFDVKQPRNSCIATVVGAWEWSRVSHDREVFMKSDPRRVLRHYNPDGQGYVLMLSNEGIPTFKYPWLGEQLDGHLKLVQLCKVNNERGTL